jgi:hypothetical protein
MTDDADEESSCKINRRSFRTSSSRPYNKFTIILIFLFREN